MLITPSRARKLCALLRGLYEQQDTSGPNGHYVAEHGRPAVVTHQVNVFCWYARYLTGGAVLDWGCQHGPDSCLLRAAFGDEIDLHACDFVPESEHAAFRAYARPRYAQLTGPFDLPYPDGSFDAVIASGVLEHAAMDGESLKALHRVIRPGGALVITYLPYALSFDEWKRRNVRKAGYHRRLYTRRDLYRLLLGHGFYPEEVRFHTFVPNVVSGSWWVKTALASLLFPFRHSTLCCVARRVHAM